MAILGTLVISGLVATGCVALVSNYRRKVAREQHIRHYMFPRGLFEKFAQARPGLDVKQQQLVARALRQFFLTYLKSGCNRVAMPSQVVDDLWHEFILFTRDYGIFCSLAFGQFLHHTPAVKLGTARSDNEGLRRVWWYSCLEENINPRKPTRLPLLFALDGKLGIQGGFVYQLDCHRTPREVARDGSVGSQCASHFSDAGVDGSTDGFGNSGGDRGRPDDHHGDASDGGSDSSGCSGGCGGD